MLSIAPPPALPAHTVSLLLSHISSLDRALPPHLLSTPLRQRHTFLGLGNSLDTAEEAAAYLCWPGQSSEDATAVADLLANLPSSEGFDPLAAYETRYSFDGDAVYAHANVPITSIPMAETKGLRLVFRWEAGEEDGAVQDHDGQATNVNNWKFHDAKPMPFPSSTRDTPDEACNPPAGTQNVQQRKSQSASGYMQPEMNGTVHHGTAGAGPEADFGGKEEEDDDYWESYGRSNSDDEGEAKRSLSAGIPRSYSKISDDGKAEDAYWAQYASVHGSADSTRPSPLPQKRKLHDPNQPLPGSATSSYFERFEPAGRDDNLSRSESDDHLNSRGLFFTTGRRELQPGEPCPDVLARRLYAASPRPTRSPSPALPAVAEDATHLHELLQDGSLAKEMENGDIDPDGFEMLGSPGSSEGRTLTPPGPLSIEEQLSPVRLSKSKSQSPIDEDVADVALRESIKGLYTLWTLRRGSEGIETEERERFLHLVKDVLDTTP